MGFCHVKSVTESLAFPYQKNVIPVCQIKVREGGFKAGAPTEFVTWVHPIMQQAEALELRMIKYVRGGKLEVVPGRMTKGSYKALSLCVLFPSRA